jgi:hypothetical protein
MSEKETGLDRCIRTVVAAVMTLRDCGESDSDIAKALNAVNLFGPLEVIKRMDAASQEDRP